MPKSKVFFLGRLPWWWRSTHRAGDYAKCQWPVDFKLIQQDFHLDTKLLSIRYFSLKICSLVKRIPVPIAVAAVWSKWLSTFSHFFCIFLFSRYVLGICGQVDTRHQGGQHHQSCPTRLGWSTLPRWWGSQFWWRSTWYNTMVVVNIKVVTNSKVAEVTIMLDVNIWWLRVPKRWSTIPR